jgi:WD40 repeat protein
MLVRLWDFGLENDGTFETIKTLVGHDHTVSCAAFSKDGAFVYVARFYRQPHTALEEYHGECWDSITQH